MADENGMETQPIDEITPREEGTQGNQTDEQIAERAIQGEQPAQQLDEELIREALEDRNNREYLKERHQQAVNELKVSSNSAKPQLVMGIALVGVLALIILASQFLW